MGRNDAETPDKLELLSLIDILVDGRYDKSKRNLMLLFLRLSLTSGLKNPSKKGKVVIWDSSRRKKVFEQVKRDDLRSKSRVFQSVFWILCISIQGILLYFGKRYFTNASIMDKKVIINAFFAKNMLQ